jgi:hypothetical protein
MFGWDYLVNRSKQERFGFGLLAYSYLAIDYFEAYFGKRVLFYGRRS